MSDTSCGLGATNGSTRACSAHSKTRRWAAFDRIIGLDLDDVPIGWVIDGANRNDVRMLEPTLEAVAELGLLADKADSSGLTHADIGI